MPKQHDREFGDRFTVKPDTGIIELHCGSHAPFAEQWPVGYHPSAYGDYLNALV